MKKIYASIIFICAVVTLHAQDTEDSPGFVDRFFNAWGVSPLLDIGFTPGRVVYPVVGNHDTVCITHQSNYWGLFSIAYEARYNVVTSGDNFAISVKGKPTFSFCTSNNSNFGGFYIPLGVGLEVGNGATYQTASNMGFTLTAGYSFNMIPLTAGDIDDAAGYDYKIKTTWGSPYVAAGIRYWNKKNKLREINILYGFGGKNDEIPANVQLRGNVSENENRDSFYPSMMICVTWMRYLNY